ncbi:MAG: omega-amidase [Parvicellaceae bacterium]|jgi:omega-amidase
MDKNLKVTVVQSILAWEDPQANFAHFEILLKGLSNVDLILLPEMFNTGFSMESSKLSETMDGASVSWMKKIAKEKNSAIAGSVIIEEAGKHYNRLVWVLPDGSTQHYNKRHLFRMANEHEFFTQGEERVIIEYKGWRICPMVCYDLRFPVWSRNDTGYDLVFYVANWPAARIDAWSTLLKARAIENQCFAIGVNRVGADESNRSYCGGSAVHDPKGVLLSNFKNNQEDVQTFELDLNELNDFRSKFPVDMDRDNFTLR